MEASTWGSYPRAGGQDRKAFQNPFDLMKAGLSLDAIWRLRKQGALTGLSIRAHLGLVLSLYDHLRIELPGLILLEEDSPLSHHRASFQRLLRGLGRDV